MLLLRLLRQPEFRLAKFAQLGDVAEHRDRRHRLAGLPTPQPGGGDRERARLAAALDADYAALCAGALGRRVEHLLREIVEALPRDEQLGEVPPVRLAGLKAQYALGRRVESLDPPGEAHHQHPVLEVVEHLAVDVRPVHRPTCSTLIPHRSSVVPSVLSSEPSESR